MAKTKKQKKIAIKAVSDEMAEAKVVLFSTFEKISVNTIRELRKSLREQGASYVVMKKKLLPIALKKAGINTDNLDLPGSLAVVVGKEDEIQPAKVLAEFGQANEGVKVVGAVLGGEYLDEAQAQDLAKLPGKDELRGKLVYLFNYPASGFVNALAGNIKNLVNVLNNIKDSQEKSA